MQPNPTLSQLQDFVGKNTLTWHKSNTWYARNRDRVLREAKNRRRSSALWLDQKANPQWRRLYSAAKTRAKDKGLPFSLTPEWVQLRLGRGVCEFTGIEFRTAIDGKPAPYSASIDRIDPKQGYTPENSRMVLWAFNRMKGDMSDAETLALARAVLQSR